MQSVLVTQIIVYRPILLVIVSRTHNVTVLIIIIIVEFKRSHVVIR